MGLVFDAIEPVVYSVVYLWDSDNNYRGGKTEAEKNQIRCQQITFRV